MAWLCWRNERLMDTIRALMKSLVVISGAKNHYHTGWLNEIKFKVFA